MAVNAIIIILVLQDIILILLKIHVKNVIILASHARIHQNCVPVALKAHYTTIPAQ
jgi:hypothetical protein